MRVFASVRTPPLKRARQWTREQAAVVLDGVLRSVERQTAPRTGVPGVVVHPRAEDEFVPVPGFDRLVAVARRGALVGWTWVSRVFGVETVQEARHAGASFGLWEEYGGRP